ncbi:MAG: alcohol dehydrogenase catalytic domain-containing protein [Candidatus Lokiarchaeota archaeon]|nr:alcohol dehydrogenase catalytic domain-containing protein [Candidatus Lokiarchaeota archaeon]
MKAAVFNGKYIKIEEFEKPLITETQVLVKVKAVGICGTDIAIYNGHLLTPTPLILGHEFSGEIVEIGEKVDSYWLNKRVTAEINANIDFDCFYCQKAMYTQCVSRKALGIDINGAFAEYIALDSYLLHEIPNKISFEEATFIEPLAAAYQTFVMMPVDKDDKVIAIFGLGKLGLLLVQVALLKELEVIVIDGSDKKLQMATNWGALHSINRLNCNEIPEEIKKLTKNLGADIVLDTTGNPDSLNNVVKSCRTRGKIHIKSTHGIDVPINLTDIVVREITLYSSRCGPFELAIQGLESGKIQVKDLISNIYTLPEIEEAFNSYEINKDQIKAIIKF